MWVSISNQPDIKIDGKENSNTLPPMSFADNV